jgi:hypothetical protein
MTVPCQPMPQQLASEMLQIVARAMCDRPGDSSALRDSRTSQMVHSVLGFEPRDGLEYMLSSIAVGHFHLILDSMHDVFHGQEDAPKAKTKTTIVALDRAMLEMVRELRVEQRRPAARTADASRGEDAGVTASAPIEAPEPFAAEEAPGMAAGPAVPAEERRTEADAVETVPAAAKPEQTGRVEAILADSETGQWVSAPVDDRAEDAAWVGGPLTASFDDPPQTLGMSEQTPGETGEGMEERHLAAFRAAMAAVLESATQAAAPEKATPGATIGD